MSAHTLYAYVSGFDLHEVVNVLEEALDSFVSGRSWSRKTWVVNQQYPRDEHDGPDDLPAWNLGLNHELPDAGTETAGWFKEVAEIAYFLGDLAERFGREFVIGIASGDTGVADDLHCIATRDVDLSRLEAIVGVLRPPTGGNSWG